MQLTDVEFEEWRTTIVRGKPVWTATDPQLKRVLIALPGNRTFHQLMVVTGQAVADVAAKSVGVIHAYWDRYLHAAADTPAPRKAAPAKDDPRFIPGTRIRRLDSHPHWRDPATGWTDPRKMRAELHTTLAGAAPRPGDCEHGYPLTRMACPHGCQHAG